MIGRSIGTVLDAHAGLVRAALAGAAVGDSAQISAGESTIHGYVQSVGRDAVTILPHGAVDGIVAGDSVSTMPAAFTLQLGMAALGRAIDARGAALDARGPLIGRATCITLEAPSPTARAAVDAPLWTGVKVIDGLLTLGRGARVGVFGSPSAGKSTLLAMLADGICADAIVVGLIGERGREAQRWIAGCNPRTTIVCASSDRSAAERVCAAKAAMAQANALRARGLDVLLILDSLARYGAALREIAVACGEPVGRGGFPASVFAELAQLVETAGRTRTGSVTLVASVLCEGPDEHDPLGEAARSLLDGHIVLDRELASAGRFPAVDVLSSASRTMACVVKPQHLRAAAVIRRALAALKETEDARSLGLPLTDAFALQAQNAMPQLESFLRQGEFSIKAPETMDELHAVADILEGRSWTSPAI